MILNIILYILVLIFLCIITFSANYAAFKEKDNNAIAPAIALTFITGLYILIMARLLIR